MGSHDSIVFDLDKYLGELRERVNTFLKECLPPPSKEDHLRLREAMESSLIEGGKRIRPCLTIASCQAVGGTVEQALAPACAVELIHAYSLVHDDLPALDNDALRRGKPTCHKQFGETTAILVGDALLALAFEILSAAGLAGEHAVLALRASHELARAAGARGMVGGQAMDMAMKKKDPPFDRLELCHAGKTAAIFSASAAIGAIVGGGEESAIDALRSFGFDLGLAFQHADDLMDDENRPHRERAKRRANDLLRRAAQSVERFGEDAAPLVALTSWIEDRVRKASSDEAARKS
jgi:geranylgeranyl pyrophosphate synthase